MKINAPHYFPVELFINKWTRRVALTFASSETQGQRVGARESLNGRENMARRKEKDDGRTPGDDVLPDQFQTVAAVLASDWCQKTFVFFSPIKRQNGGDRLELVW